MDLAEKVHNERVNDLARRLDSKGYDLVITRGEYWGCEHVKGECDIIALRNGIVNYYEYKTSKRGKAKAHRQLERFSLLHPNLDTRLICVTGKRRFHVDRYYGKKD